MLHRVESRRSLEEVGRGLEAAAQKYKFGVLAIHDLKAKMHEKGVEFDRDCIIYEVCNPPQAKKVLEANAEISTALPCRIAVYKEGDGITLATLRPTALIDLFNTPVLRAVAQEVEKVIVSMMIEAAG
jgi:uncharacterized protein (DUF302 family)